LPDVVTANVDPRQRSLTAPGGAWPDHVKGGKYGKDNSWRCKECHGWDYKGKDGAYAKGSAFQWHQGHQCFGRQGPGGHRRHPARQDHGYSEAQLSAKDATDLALFVSKGQGNLAKYVSTPCNKSTGDAAKGEVYYNTVCAPGATAKTARSSRTPHRWVRWPTTAPR
jgi:hypothetical protein